MARTAGTVGKHTALRRRPAGRRTLKFGERLRAPMRAFKVAGNLDSNQDSRPGVVGDASLFAVSTGADACRGAIELGMTIPGSLRASVNELITSQISLSPCQVTCESFR